MQYRMRGQSYQIRRPQDSDEMNRLNWVASNYSDLAIREAARKAVAQGVEVVSTSANTNERTLDAPLTQRFSEIALTVRQMLRRRSIEMNGTSVTFPTGTKISHINARNQGVEVVVYALPDGLQVCDLDGDLGKFE